MAALQREWRPRVYAWAVGVTHDQELAEDVAQEVFRRAWDALPRFRGDCGPGAWLHRITINCARTALKRSGQPAVFFSDLDCEDDEDREFDVEGGVDPAAELELRMTCEAVRAAVNALPLKWREPILLVDLQGLSYEEAAETLGLKLGQLKMRLKRGRQALSPLLAAD